MLESQYAQLCQEIRSTDEVTFNLQRNLLLCVLVCWCIQVYVDTVNQHIFFTYLCALYVAFISLVFYVWDLRNMQVCYAALKMVEKIEAGSFKGKEIKTYSAPRALKFGLITLSKLWAIHMFYFSSMFFCILPAYILSNGDSFQLLFSVSVLLIIFLFIVCGYKLHTNIRNP